MNRNKNVKIDSGVIDGEMRNIDEARAYRYNKKLKELDQIKCPVCKHQDFAEHFIVYGNEYSFAEVYCPKCRYEIENLNELEELEHTKISDTRTLNLFDIDEY